MTASKDYHDIHEQHLADANEQDDQARRQLRRYYPVSANKRDPSRPPAEGWQTLSSISAARHTMMGRLQWQLSQQHAIVAVVSEHIMLPPGARFQAAINRQGELVVTVSTASLAHQLRYDLPQAKAAIERKLAVSISAMKIQVDPTL